MVVFKMETQYDMKSNGRIKNNFNDSSGIENSISVTRYISRVCGIWPELEEKKSFATRYFFIIPTLIIIFTLIMPQVRRAMLFSHDFRAVLEVMSTGIVMEFITVLKIIGIRLNQSELRWLLGQMINDWKNSNHEQRKIMYQYSNITRFITTICISLTVGNIVIQIIKQSILYFWERYQSMSNETVIKPTIIKSDFYFDIQPEGIYEVVAISQVLGTLYLACAFTACDGFFVLSILHVSGQFYNLQLYIEDLMQNNGQTNNCFTRNLARIVIQHRRLCGRADIIEENFNKIFLFQMIGASILLCLQGFELAMVINKRGTEMIPYLLFSVCFFTSNLVSIFTYCYAAEILRDQSEGLFRSVYKIRWYDLAPKESRLLMIIMIQTEKPIDITVGKFVALSLNYFCSILRTSGGYLSMLLAVQQKI